MGLVNSVLCHEFDPCCDNCDIKEIEKAKRQRLSINQIISLQGTLLALIHTEQIDYLGVMDMQSDRFSKVSEISALLDKIKAILERCGLCQGAWQSLAPTNNTSKGYKPCNC